LKQHAQLEFTERLAMEETVGVVERIAGADDVEAELGPFANDPLELFAGAGRGVGVVE
jgi:hypothetical protein